ncbi:MAG: methyltransferase domain-containing protein [Pseudomonadota bacterium]
MNIETVKAYYGQTLQSSSDLKTDACSTLAAPPREIAEALSQVHPDVSARYYGCGLAIPSLLKGLRVLDLGCGAGRDVFALARLVGPNGSVVGVDMTPEQLAVARDHEAWHADAFGYDAPNTRFLEGYLEDLDALDLDAESFDLIISNCVINLCVDKPAVFKSAYRLLKPGGELYFADVYADRRMPETLRADPELYGECLSGALYWNDYNELIKSSGFADPRVVEHRPIEIVSKDMIEKTRPIRFASVTARLMKLETLEPACEDYGQAVIYNGGVPGMERVFKLDVEHEIEAGRVFPACGNTIAMLKRTRFAPYFDVVGDGETHFGAFPGCGAPDVFAETEIPDAAPAGGCC